VPIQTSDIAIFIVEFKLSSYVLIFKEKELKFRFRL